MKFRMLMVRVKKRSFRVQQICDILRLMWCKYGRHQRWSSIRRNCHTPVWKEICLSWPLQLTSGYFLKFWTSYKPYVLFLTRMKHVSFYASARVLTLWWSRVRSGFSKSPESCVAQSFCSLLKYICCKNCGCTRTLGRINWPCGMYLYRQVWRFPTKLKFQDVEFIALTLTMSSSNEEKPVKLLALGKVLMV